MNNIKDKINNFKATDDEYEDLDFLFEITDQISLEDMLNHPHICESLIKVFENNPHSDLGSPGPIIHKLEELPIEKYINLVTDSILRSPNHMVAWMAKRCLNSKITQDQKQKILDSLAQGLTLTDDEFVIERITEIIKNT